MISENYSDDPAVLTAEEINFLLKPKVSPFMEEQTINTLAALIIKKLHPLFPSSSVISAKIDQTHKINQNNYIYKISFFKKDFFLQLSIADAATLVNTALGCFKLSLVSQPLGKISLAVVNQFINLIAKAIAQTFHLSENNFRITQVNNLIDKNYCTLVININNIPICFSLYGDFLTTTNAVIHFKPFNIPIENIAQWKKGSIISLPSNQAQLIIPEKLTTATPTAQNKNLYTVKLI